MIEENEQILIFKLSSGEEIIGTVDDMRAEEVDLNDTILVMFVPDPQTGKFTPSFYPWFPAGVDPKVVDRKHIMCMSELEPKLLEVYKKITGKSRVIAPPQGIAIP